jgi:hypothetical protein
MVMGNDFRRSLMAGILRGSTTEQKMEVSKRGELCIVDFFTEMALEGRAYQIRAGTVATGLAADSTLTDTAANMCVDALAGIAIIPCCIRLAMLDVATGTTLSCYMKAVGVVSSAGTAFVPLPLLQGGLPARSTARVATDGGVTVTAELATTTRRLWEFVALQTQSATVLAVGALGAIASQTYTPILPYVGNGPACVYVQVAATTAFTLHFGALDYIELPSTMIGP